MLPFVSMSFASRAAHANLAELVKLVVEASGSQNAAAKRLGLSQTYLSQLLRGKIRNVRESTVRVIETKFGLPLGTLNNEGIDLPSLIKLGPPGTVGALAPTMAVALARRVLESRLQGQPASPEVVRAMAHQVLTQREVRLAQAILDAESPAKQAEAGEELALVLLRPPVLPIQ